MANGIAGLRPFPTFGDKTGGITPVNLAPTNPRFPVARPINVAPAREDVNPLSYLAPIGLSFLANKFFGGQQQPVETKTEEQLLEMDATQLAKYKADVAFGGDKTQTTGQRIGELLTQYGPALFTDNDKELAAYINTANTMGAASRAGEDKRILNKANYTANLLKDKKLDFENYIDTDSVASGQPISERTGLAHPTFGLLIHDPDNSKAIKKGPYRGYALQQDIKGNWVKSGSFDKDRITSFQNPELETLLKKKMLANQTDIDALNTLKSINAGIKNIDNSAEGSEPLATFGGAFTNFTNDVMVNLRALSNSTGLPIFDQTLDANGQKAGANAEILATLFEQRDTLIAQDLPTNEIDKRILDAADTFETYGKRTNPSFRLFDEKSRKLESFQKVQLLGNYISLGYKYAGSEFGQSGKNLSDKDLAFALQSIGFGATQDKEVAKAQLMSIGYKLINDQDTEQRLGFNPQDYLNVKRDNQYKNALSGFWLPNTMLNNPQTGKEEPDWTTDPSFWNYIDFENRIGKKLGSNRDGGQINPVTAFLKFKSDLYNPTITKVGTEARKGLDNINLIKNEPIEIPEFNNP